MSDQKSRKRNRPTAVCDFCKKRKVKCNKEYPCSTCMKYDPTKCHYSDGNGTDNAKPSSNARSSFQSQLQILQDKISKLETSLTHPPLVSNNPSNISTANGFKTLKIFDRSLGNNPVAFPNETFSFFEGYSYNVDTQYLKNNQWPLSCMGLIRRDPGFSHAWNSALMRKHEDFGRNYSEDNMNLSGSSEIYFYRKATEAKERDDLMAYKNGNNFPNKCSSNKFETKINRKAKSSGLLLHEGDINEEIMLIQKIQSVMPKQKTIWKLITRFFNRVYPFLPFIDEDLFKNEISKIIGPEKYDKEELECLNVKKRTDFAHLGLLFVVIRLSFLTLFTNIASINESNMDSNDPSIAAQEIKYLLNEPIKLEVIQVAEDCLAQFNLLRVSNIAIFQLAFYLQVYYKYSPENDDEIDRGNSQVFIGTLIQMAYAMGLNRDPIIYLETSKDIKLNNLRRKLWYYTLILDSNNALNSGSPLSVLPYTFDTRVPFHEPQNENVSNVELEKNGLMLFANFDIAYEPLSKLILMISSVGRKIVMSDLMEQLNYFELYLIKDCGKLRMNLNNLSLIPEQYFSKALKIKLYFTSNQFLISIYFHLFNYYEIQRKHNLTFHYLRKILIFTITELLPFYPALLDKSPTIFKTSTDLFLTPGFELIIEKSIIINIAILIRVNSVIFKFRKSESHPDRMLESSYSDHFLRLCRLSELLEKSSKIFIETISRLSNRYSYAKRIGRSQNVVLDIVTTDSFYDNDLGFANAFINFSNDMLDELIEVLEVSLEEFSSKKSSEDDEIINDEDLDAYSGINKFSDYGTLDNSSLQNNEKSHIIDSQIDELWLQLQSVEGIAEGNLPIVPPNLNQLHISQFDLDEMGEIQSVAHVNSVI